MVQANELRINNWVLEVGEFSSIYQIERGGSSIYRINDIAYNSQTGCTFNGGEDRIQPIPLTPTILHDAGFSERKGEWSLGGFILTRYQDEFVFKVIDQIVNYNPIKYVHQLQNIYHSLCRRELDIEF